MQNIWSSPAGHAGSRRQLGAFTPLAGLGPDRATTHVQKSPRHAAAIGVHRRSVRRLVVIPLLSPTTVEPAAVSRRGLAGSARTLFRPTPSALRHGRPRLRDARGLRRDRTAHPDVPGTRP